MPAKPRKPAAVTADALKARRAIVDRAGELNEKIKPLEPLKKECDALKKQIRGFAADVPAELTTNIYGDRYLATLTAMTEESQKDLERIYTRIGHKAFLKAVSMTDEKLKELFPDESERASFVSKSRTGSRRVTTVKIAA